MKQHLLVLVFSPSKAGDMEPHAAAESTEVKLRSLCSAGSRFSDNSIAVLLIILSKMSVPVPGTQLAIKRLYSG